MKKTKSLSLILIISLAIILLSGCSGGIDLSKAVTIEDGFVNLDTPTIINQMYKEIGIESQEDYYEVLESDYEKAEKAMAINLFSYTFDIYVEDNGEELSKGDKVKVIVTYDEDMAEELGFNFKNAETTLKVN